VITVLGKPSLYFTHETAQTLFKIGDWCILVYSPFQASATSPLSNEGRPKTPPRSPGLVLQRSLMDALFTAAKKPTRTAAGPASAFGWDPDPHRWAEQDSRGKLGTGAGHSGSPRSHTRKDGRSL